MGLYNTVTLNRLAPCPRCGHDGEIQVQFAYGDTYLLHYEMGDPIKWGENSNTVVGLPSDGAVEIVGFHEWCPVCGLEAGGDYAMTGDPDHHTAEYVLVIQDAMAFSLSGS